MYYKYSDYLKQKYGEKVYKIPVNLPVSCPNRDGTIGKGGCAFCADTGAGFESLPADMPVGEQIARNIETIGPKYKAQKFIVYFQNYSNTYLPLDVFRAALAQASRRGDVVGISISTRPDLIREDYLKAARDTGKDITFELGLQSINHKTLQKIGRGHTLAEFIDAVLRIRPYGFAISTHVILNLPWDDDGDAVECAKILSTLPITMVKLHSLYIMEGTRLGEMYRDGAFEVISCEEYLNRLGLFLQHLRPDIAVERLIARAPQEDALFVNWGMGSYRLLSKTRRYLEASGIRQGEKCRIPGGSLLEKFD